MVICQNCGKDTSEGKFCEHCGAYGGTTATFQQSVTAPIKVSQSAEGRHAGFWIRFWAYLIDLIILYIVAFAIGNVGSFANAIEGFRIVLVIIMIIVIWLYFAVLESSATQATVGKSLVKIKVTDLEGNRIGFRKATVRTIVRFIPVIGPLGSLRIGFTDNQQGLHDWAAGTFVIYND